MSDTIIAGVDFSGAKEQPNNTYVAFGVLTGSQFELTDVKKVGSHQVAQELTRHDGLVSVGMDFPFSLPSEFLNFWAEKLGEQPYQSWQQVAEKLIFTSYEQFLEVVTEFKKEPKRICDKSCSRPAQSPLHRGYPSMLQMTFQGIRLLASLNPEKFAVQPFQDLTVHTSDDDDALLDAVGAASPAHEHDPGEKQEGHAHGDAPHAAGSAPAVMVKNWFDASTTMTAQHAAHKCAVLEVYPRASLHEFGLPDTGYKAKDKNDEGRALSQRVHLLRDLVAFPAKIAAQDAKFSKVPQLVVHGKLEQAAVQTDHGFDAVVACYTAALWTQVPHLFEDPFANDQIEILLEGWIYSPKLAVPEVATTKNKSRK